MSEEIVDLANGKCQPCRITDRLTEDQIGDLLETLVGWTLNDETIEKEFRFNSFRAGLDFAYAIGSLAEEQDHHPDILIRWRRVKLTLSTHSIKGLSRNDFIMAAKAELEYEKLRGAKAQNS